MSRPDLVLASIAVTTPAWAAAEALSWRVATVGVTQQAGEATHRGVALFANGEPATLTLRLRPTAAPSRGRMPFATHTVHRFEDGSTFTVLGAGQAAMSTEGVPLPVESLIEGRFEGGTGRFAGIKGTVTLRSRSGMDRPAPGVPGDQPSVAEAGYTVPK